MQPEDTVAAFLHIYNEISDNGRGECLFGHPDSELLQQSLWTGIQLSQVPLSYFEFPLKGKPQMDLLVLHDTKAAPLLPSASEVPYFSAFKTADEVAEDNFAYGLEWDLSQGDIAATPGFYIDHAANSELVENVLLQLGASDRWPMVNTFFSKLPTGWSRYYIGLFPSRQGCPIRLGLSISKSKIAFYRENPQRLEQDLKDLNYQAFDSYLVKEILDPVYMPFSWDMQLDLCSDGTLGKSLGVSYYLCNGNKKDTIDYFRSESIQQLFHHLEEIELIDERWHLLPECLLSKTSYTFENGRLIKLALENHFNFLKIKWCGTSFQPAKFYFESRVSELSM